MVELHHYLEIEDMVHVAIEMEKQLKKKRVAKLGANANSTITSNWKSKWSMNEMKYDERIILKRKRMMVEVMVIHKL